MGDSPSGGENEAGSCDAVTRTLWVDAEMLADDVAKLDRHHELECCEGADCGSEPAEPYLLLNRRVQRRFADGSSERARISILTIFIVCSFRLDGVDKQCTILE